uniref:(California timema) hypothetical protein n=1 Tax=Timema californicum TaxID=61474 RepID=A0A7R9PAS0_TIMCA|nr:unnamed protein product [Timema californicum]
MNLRPVACCCRQWGQLPVTGTPLHHLLALSSLPHLQLEAYLLRHREIKTPIVKGIPMTIQDRDWNPDIHVIGSTVYGVSEAFNQEATNVGYKTNHNIRQQQNNTPSSSVRQDRRVGGTFQQPGKVNSGQERLKLRVKNLSAVTVNITVIERKSTKKRNVTLGLELHVISRDHVDFDVEKEDTLKCIPGEFTKDARRKGGNTFKLCKEIERNIKTNQRVIGTKQPSTLTPRTIEGYFSLLVVRSQSVTLREDFSVNPLRGNKLCRRQHAALKMFASSSKSEWYETLTSSLKTSSLIPDVSARNNEAIKNPGSQLTKTIFHLDRGDNPLSTYSSQERGEVSLLNPCPKIQSPVILLFAGQNNTNSLETCTENR